MSTHIGNAHFQGTGVGGRSRNLPKRDITQTYWAREQEEVAHGLSLERRMELLRQHGDFSMGYSTAVQPLLNYFANEDGYYAFRRRWGMNFALGDPMVAETRRADFLKAFATAHRNPSFVQVSRATAEQLSCLGYRVNEMGVDTSLDLQTYDFAGKQKEWLRYADNWVTRRGYEIRETSYSEITPDDVEAVSEAWRKTRTIKNKEVRFLNRPIVMTDEPEVRKWFLISPEGQMQAFIYFDPIWKNGAIRGYVSCIKRRHPNAPLYAEHAIMKRAIAQFREEGHAVLKLGLSPLAGIEDKEFRCSRMLSGLSRYLFRAKWLNRRWYNLQGHAGYKKRFRGEEEKVYYASPGRNNGLRFFCLASLCGAF